jgi:transaldolase/glucose-6-phosphate isomerase
LVSKLRRTIPEADQVTEPDTGSLSVEYPMESTMHAVAIKHPNPLQQLSAQGQSVWLDYIRASLISSGTLERMIREDALTGLTSNPSIFQKAIAGSTDYRETLQSLGDTAELDPAAIFERLAIEDIRRAADQFAPVYHATHRRDGYVSLEVSPWLAHDTNTTIAEARRLWKTVARPNLLIKVPATPAALPAIETLLAEGISVNVTLLFSVDVYRQVAETFVRALEARVATGADLSGIASVASFFVSRIDTAVDSAIAERLGGVSNSPQAEILRSLQGKVAIASARLAYRHYQELFSGERWARLQQAGAQPQRLLWASTSTKNPAYRDVLYVEELIGPDTVNTLPPATLEAFRDHGIVRDTLTGTTDKARRKLATLAGQGIELEVITQQLLGAGVDAFAQAYDQLLDTIDRVRSGNSRRHQLASLDLPQDLQQASETIIRDFAVNDKIHRLWARDATIWTGTDENRWLDWLDVAATQLDHLGDLKKLMHFAEGQYFQHAVLLGMGGSSLAPELFARIFGQQANHPGLLVLDSTDPEQIGAVEAQIDLARTAFIVASKSGTTLEPNLLLDYFFAKVSDAIGGDRAAAHFGVITDPGSPLETRAQAKGFRRVFHGRRGIGGRYSALSNFGMVPAAVAGIDVGRLLRQAETLAEACAACSDALDNPGLQLGAVLGAAYRCRRDKITFICTPSIAALGAWLEQLLAESTGKQGKALIPIAGEQPGAAAQYGNDRLFVYLRLADRPDPQQDLAVEQLRAAGQALVQIDIDDLYDLGGELFRWEFATAVAGSVMGINCFNQPDVESAKVAAREMTDVYEKDGKLPPQIPLMCDGPLSVFIPRVSQQAFEADHKLTATGLLRAHLDQLQAGDYFALLAYLNRFDESLYTRLQQLRHAIRDRYRVATSLGYGPRYLHSTGQAHKGGPDTGLFLMITADHHGREIAVPGRHAGFATTETAQAVGDFQVLASRDRRVMRIHISGAPSSTLPALEQLHRAVLSD